MRCYAQLCHVRNRGLWNFSLDVIPFFLSCRHCTQNSSSISSLEKQILTVNSSSIVSKGMRKRRYMSNRSLEITIRSVFSSSNMSLMPIPIEESGVVSRIGEASSELSTQSVIYPTIPLLATNVDTRELSKVVIHNGLPQVADVVLIDTRALKKGTRVLPRPRVKRIRMEYESHWAAFSQEVPRRLIILVKTDLTRTSAAKKLLASLAALIEGVDRISIAVVISRRSRLIEHFVVQRSAMESLPSVENEDESKVFAGAEGKETASITPAIEENEGKKEPFQCTQSDASGEKNASYNASMECETTMEHTLSETTVKTSSDAAEGMSAVVGTNEIDPISEVSEPKYIADLPTDRKNVEKTAVQSETSRIEDVLSDVFLATHRKENSPETLIECTSVAVDEEKSNFPLAKDVAFVEGEKKLSDVDGAEQQTRVSHETEGEEEMPEENVMELQEDFLGASPEDEPELVLEDITAFNDVFPPSVRKDVTGEVTAVEVDFDEEKQVKNGAMLSSAGGEKSEPDLQASITPSSVFKEEEAHINVSPQVCATSSSPPPLTVKEKAVHPHAVQATTATAELAATAVELDLQEDEKIFSGAIGLNEEVGFMKVPLEEQHQNTLPVAAGAASKSPSGSQETSENNTDDVEKESEIREAKETREGMSNSENMYALRKEHFAFFSSAFVGCRLMGSSAAQSLLSKHLIDTSPFLPFFSYSFASNSMGNTLGKENNVVPLSSSGSSTVEKTKVVERKESKARSFANGSGLNKVESREELSVTDEPSFSSISLATAAESGKSEVKAIGEAMEPHGNSRHRHTSIVVKAEDRHKNEVKPLFPRVVHAKNDMRGEELSGKPESPPSSSSHSSSLSLGDTSALQSPNKQKFTKSDRNIPMHDKKTKFVSPDLQSRTKSAKKNLQKSSSSLLAAISAPVTPAAPSISSLNVPNSSFTTSNKEKVVEIKHSNTTRTLSVSPAADAAPVIDAETSVTQQPCTLEIVTASIKAQNVSKVQEKASSNLVHSKCRSTSSSRATKKSEPRKKVSTVSPKQLVPCQKKQTKKEQKESYDFSNDNSLSAQLSRRLKEELRERALQKKMLKSILKEKNNPE